MDDEAENDEDEDDDEEEVVLDEMDVGDDDAQISVIITFSF